MRHLIFSFVTVLVLAAGCGGNSSNGPSGQTCNPADLGKCDGAILYLCTSQDEGNTYQWQKNIDCSQSTTSGCTCAIIEDTPMCATGTDSNAGTCQGTSVQ